MSWVLEKLIITVYIHFLMGGDRFYRRHRIVIIKFIKKAAKTSQSESKDKTTVLKRCFRGATHVRVSIVSSGTIHCLWQT